MFCYQCEQTAKGTGCTVRGVCGKTEETADLQDLLTYTLRGLGLVATEARQAGISDNEANRFTCEALFSTLTNVNFDNDRFPPLINRGVELRESLKARLPKADFDQGPATFKPTSDLAGLIAQGAEHGFKYEPDLDPDITSLQHTVIFGLRGVAAYADHAAILGQEDESVYAFIHQALAATLDKSLSLENWLKLTLKCGQVNLKAMELLDAANTGAYGHPVPTSVPLGHKKGKAILVSGHDLQDLELILKQSQGKGINVYTHGEMLPCHGYPELKKYDHFYGHYGTAWQNQGKEFPAFPGAILMTTNCIQKPKGDTGDKIFTTGLVGWPGVPHIGGQGADKDFSAVIDKALALPGFSQDEDKGSVMVGFGHQAVLNVADKVIEAVKSGAIRHFFLVGGCDGAKPGRSYYSDFVDKAPQDTVILTLACGKFRFFDKQLGDIGGIPRLLDIGQCNDAYSAIQIALALAQAFGTDVNGLPLSMILSWYEQKAVAILLTLLHLGIKDIRLGPSLPAVITPNVLQVLVDNFNIRPISTPEEDLKAILG
ncbi:MAG: hydroxylamine reductase [Deltaproteobacteria bacterium]|nr:hydroxylamine reductase [Deltaproteobacteria bacterium]